MSTDVMSSEGKDKIHPRHLTGVSSSIYLNSVDQGWNGLYAAAFGNLINVIESDSGNAVTVLSGCHKVTVTLVKFEHQPSSDIGGNSQPDRLASVDESGLVVIWDVLHGVAISQVKTNAIVNDLAWMPHHQLCRDMVSIIQGSRYGLYNCATGGLVWEKRYDLNRDETFKSIQYDPFDSSKLYILTSVCIMKQIDFGLSLPKKSARRVYLDDAKRSFYVGREAQDIQSSVLKKCIAFSMLPSVQNAGVLVFSRCLVFCDISTLDVFSVIEMDRSTSPLLAVRPCVYRPVFYCLHESASVSMRVYQITYESTEHNMKFSSACHSEGIRMTGWCKCRGITIDPRTESTVIVQLSDGKIIQWQLEANAISESEKPVKRNRLFYGRESHGPSFIADIVGPSDLISTDMANYKPVAYSLRQVAQYGHSGASIEPIIRSCPALNSRNWFEWAPKIARGTKNGTIQIFNLYTGRLTGEYSVHTNSVADLHWLDMNRIVSLAVSPGATSSTFLNIIALLNCRSGRVTIIRRSKSSEAAIDQISPSPTASFLLVTFKTTSSGNTSPTQPAYQPPEFWSIEGNSGKLLRRFPVYNTPLMYVAPTWWQSKSLKTEGEKFFFIDLENNIRILESLDTKLKEIKDVRIKAELGLVTASAWKANIIVLGYADGSLSAINSKTKLATTKQTQLGRIDFLQFAPGKGNTLLLVSTERELAVWDVREVALLSRIKKKAMEIVSADWVSSDQLAASMMDASIRVFSFNFHLESMSCHPVNSSRQKESPKKALEDMLTILNQPSINGNLVKIEKHFQTFGNETGLRFSLLLRACFEMKWCRIDSWLLGGMANPNKSRIALTLESRLDRLSTIMKRNESTEAQTLKNERRLSQLMTIFGKGHLALPILLGTNCEQHNFMENSLRGLVLIMLQDDNEKAESVKHHVKMVSATLLNAGRILDAVELLMISNCFTDAIMQLVEQGHYILAKQINSIVIDKENDNSNELITKRWSKHLLKNGSNEDALSLMVANNKYDDMVKLFVNNRHFLRVLLLSELKEDLLIAPDTTKIVNDGLLNYYEKYEIDKDIRRFLSDHTLVDTQSE